jgi:hydrogenase maturation protease
VPDVKTLVLGLGNPILRDDAVGLHVVQALRPLLEDHPRVHIGEDTWGGLRLMERLEGYDRAIVIDAMCSGAPPGTIRLLSPDDIPTQHSTSLHDISLPVALELGRRAGATVPGSADITLVGIEAIDVLSFGEELSPQVEAAVPKAVAIVRSLLQHT